MKLSGHYSFQAPREKVFESITDPRVLKQCIAGCEEMVQRGEDAYEARLKLGLAGMKGTYNGTVRIQDRIEPESYTLSLEGKGMPGFVKGTAKIRLRENGTATDLECEADVQVGGMIAAIGSRLIQATAKKLMNEFFDAFSQRL